MMLRKTALSIRPAARVAAGSLLLATCGWFEDAGPNLPEPAEPGTYQVAQLTETFVDDSRPTEAPDPAASAPTRTLERLGLRADLR
jgi:hypothetical protein